jgi:hypothetical protein
MDLIAIRYVTKEDDKGVITFIERFIERDKEIEARKSISEKPDFKRFITEREYLGLRRRKGERK